MRARNLKPGLLKNEILGVADPLYTILFEGLWMAADRAGRMEDRPLRLKAEIFPYRDVDMDAMLDWLQAQQFILRYEHDGEKFIQVNNFEKHQNPHTREQASTIPAPGQGKAKAKPRTRSGTTKAVPGTSAAGLTPSSLTPDSPFSDSMAAPPDVLGELRAKYPKRAGDAKWPAAARAVKARLAEGHTPTELLDGLGRYARYIRAVGSEGTQFVKTAAAFFGPDKPFLDDWEIPASKAQRAQDANVSASQEWLRQQEASDAA